MTASPSAPDPMSVPVPPLPLEVRSVTRRFDGTTAVDGVDLDVHAGEVLTVVGPSGCGKSTLLRVIAGLITIDEGEVRIAGEVADDGRTSVPPERRRVGLVFQDHALFPHLTVSANVAFGLGGRPAADRVRRATELLSLVGIEHLAERYPHEISGGERQRASLARAVAPEPQLLLLDEPFANLDPGRRSQVRSDVIGLLRRTGTPAVLVTHDQAEALALGDRVAVLDHGRLRQVGPPEDVYAQPVDRFVASYLGEASFLPAGPVLDLVLRPSDLALAVDEAGDATVTVAEFRGERWSYRVRTDAGDDLVVDGDRADRVDVGARVTVTRTDRHPVATVPAVRR